MKIKSISLTILIDILYVLTLTCIFFHQVFRGRINLHSFIIAFAFGVASLTYAYITGKLKTSILKHFFLSILAVALTIALVRYPIAANISKLSAELVTMYSLRNALIYLMFAILPISIIFIPIGAYLSESFGSRMSLKIIFIIAMLVPSCILVLSYRDYSLNVYSVKCLKMLLNNAELHFSDNHAYLDLNYTLINEGVKDLKVVLIIHDIYFENEIVRKYITNFYARPLILNPSKAVSKYISIEVPPSKVREHTVHGTLVVLIRLEVYLSTRFGTTPITFQEVTYLNVSKV